MVLERIGDPLPISVSQLHLGDRKYCRSRFNHYRVQERLKLTPFAGLLVEPWQAAQLHSLSANFCSKCNRSRSMLIARSPRKGSHGNECFDNSYKPRLIFLGHLDTMWIKDGCSHLPRLKKAWVNRRFSLLFCQVESRNKVKSSVK
jgi:hypothetical protein